MSASRTTEPCGQIVLWHGHYNAYGGIVELGRCTLWKGHQRETGGSANNRALWHCYAEKPYEKDMYEKRYPRRNG